MNERIGFIGVGIMGKAMALNLIKKGYIVTVYNRSQKSVEELRAQGAKVAANPKELVQTRRRSRALFLRDWRKMVPSFWTPP